MKKYIALGLSAALSMAVALPAIAQDSSSSSSSSVSSSSSTSNSSSVMSSSSSKKMDGSPMMGRMRAKEKANKGMGPGNPTVDIACMKTTVVKREAALAAAVDAHYASMKTAMSTRATALAAAWGMTDASAREAALKAAHTAFRTSAKTATKTLRDARKAVWKTFKADAKTCKVSVPRVESDAEKSDAAL